MFCQAWLQCNMHTSWIRMGRIVTRRLTRIRAIWHPNNIFTTLSHIEALWKLKQTRNVADDNVCGGLRVNLRVFPVSGTTAGTTIGPAPRRWGWWRRWWRENSWWKWSRWWWSKWTSRSVVTSSLTSYNNALVFFTATSYQVVSI